MKKKVVAFVALMLASLMIFSLGAKLARADQGIYEKSPEINAKSYLLTDFDGTTEIASSNKTERLPIASMVKIMTLDLVFEKIEKGQDFAWRRRNGKRKRGGHGWLAGVFRCKSYV